ncbi:unnamed protein product [Rotaria sordida]|uniref:UNC93-like protein n=1 Tax=Rotaria sordida TaxID=392033 RepID=A0A813S410_9BILA|nr:unnamed protein product [Rotaria sordida]
MAHIIDDVDTIPRKLSFVSSSAEDQIAVGAKVGNMIVDNHTSLSDIVLPLNNNSDDQSFRFSINKIYKNLLILSLAFALLFTAYAGISTLQSTLNTKNNVGINALIVTNVLVIFSSIFLTSISMDIFGLKWSIVLAEVGYILFIVANIRPLPSLMYISAAFVGLAAAPLWTAQATYLSQIARLYAQAKHQMTDVVVSLFFGIFFACVGTSAIWGNLISYFVLNQSNYPQKLNCGVYFDPQSAVTVTMTSNVSEKTRYILCGIFSGLGILSIILLVFMLDQIRLNQKQPVQQSLKKCIEVLQSFTRWKSVDQFFLIPLTMWTLIENSFFTAQFTRGFVNCLIGIRYVGLVMMCHGICDVIGSYLFGHLVKCVGRKGCFIIAAALNYAMIVLMFLWQPDDSQMIILFVIAGCWGAADAVWQSQVIATYTVLYSESDPSVVAKYRLWKSVGSLISLSYASYITIYLTLILLLVYLTVSMICYGILETYLRCKDYRKKQDNLIN